MLLTVLGIGAYWLYGGRSVRQIDSVAVMPFVNASGNPEVEYLSDGMAESLINNLSLLPRLTVEARSTVFSYKGTEIPSRQAGSELAVQAVLNGRVAQRGDDLTLSLELVDVASGDLLWGPTSEPSRWPANQPPAKQLINNRDPSNLPGRQFNWEKVGRKRWP